MTQLDPSHRGTLHPKTAIFAVATVAMLSLVAVSWYVTSSRMTALEARLQELAVTLDQRLPAGDWREELARTAKRLEDRADDRLRLERRRLTAEFDARAKALAATTAASMSTLEQIRSRGEAVAPAADGAAAYERAPDPATDTVYASGSEDEKPFEEMFGSMRSSLGLEQERWAEVEVDLEQILVSLWPEYIALSKSRNPDTAGLRRRYCARVETVLAPEEATRLGCGVGAGRRVINLVQPPPAGTTP